jgi:uncharacterized repeat protein (TIGR01451 family)
MLTLTLTFLIITIYNLHAQDVALQWATGVGGLMNEHGHSVAVDKNGNVYSTGDFQDVCDFDPGQGTYNATSAGQFDIYVMKQDATGALVWAFGMGDSENDLGIEIFVDSSSNVYVTGFFEGTVDFDPGVGVYNLSSGTLFYKSAFVAKYSSSGNLIWAKSLGTSSVGNAICVDDWGYVYTIGSFQATGDFDPGPGVYSMSTAGMGDVFVSKLDSAGNFVWAKQFGGNRHDVSNDIVVDDFGNIYLTGGFWGTADLDPGPIVLNFISNGYWDIFITKLDSSGNLLWVNTMGSANDDQGRGLSLDVNGDICVTGHFKDTVDFDAGVDSFYLYSAGNNDAFICKFSPIGALKWAKNFGGRGSDISTSIVTDIAGNIYTTGYCASRVDFDPGPDLYYLDPFFSGSYISKLDVNGNFHWAKAFDGTSTNSNYGIGIDQHSNIYTCGFFSFDINFDSSSATANLTALGAYDIMLTKFEPNGLVGYAYHDLDSNCVKGPNEIGLAHRNLVITPGNHFVRTNAAGAWYLDKLLVGTYTITVDTSVQGWNLTCPPSQSFTILQSDSVVYAPSFGFKPSGNHTSPYVSIYAPNLLSGISNQKIYISASNLINAYKTLDSAYLVVTLDSFITVQSASHNYTNLGNNQYSIFVGDIQSGYRIDIILNCMVNSTVIEEQTLCMKAELYPNDFAILDNIQEPLPIGITACNSPYDNSYLEIYSYCNNDSVHFVIKNIGLGNMACFAPIQLYLDGQYIQMDSIQLLAGDSSLFAYSGDGKTWRMEVSQHPLHLGKSAPSSTIELCGNQANWTPNLINVLPHDDANPYIDIYCGLVGSIHSGNYKTGYPLGLGTMHDISRDQTLEYIIDFQNTGTIPIPTIIIRDTLSADLDISTVQTGVSSHIYSFRILPQRVLEWTFDNIYFADSASIDSLSRGFISFSVSLMSSVTPGTIIQNKATAILVNDTEITNSTEHRVSPNQTLNWIGQQTINLNTCDSVIYNSVVYNNPGIYWQTSQGNDSLFTINVINSNTSTTINENACNSYQAPDAQVYTTSGQYMAVIPNTAGCDSMITINLNINSLSSSTLTATSCDSFLSPDSQVYTTSGQYMAVIPNTAGCDSMITINLNINSSSSSTLIAASCDSFLSPDSQVYTTSGQYMAVIPNIIGCDSIITIDLTIDSLLLTTTTLSGNTLIADANNTSYQWLDCDNGFNPIIGATNQFFTPTLSGNYAVRIINGACNTISDCVNLTISEVSLILGDNPIKIYPNPVKSILNIDKGNNKQLEVKVIDNLGRTQLSEKLSDSITTLNLEKLTIGVYYIFINNGNESITYKIVKW